MEEKRQREADEITAIGMLLGAEWQGDHFVQRSVAGGYAVIYYFDRQGKPIPRPPSEG